MKDEKGSCESNKPCCEGESGKGACCGGKNKLLVAAVIVAVLAAGAFAFCKSGFCPAKKGAAVQTQQ